MASFHVGLIPDRPAREVTALVVDAEELGYATAWVADSQSLFRDAYTVLALAADQTSTIRLGTGVTNPVTRHPAVLACQFATLDELSGGRAEFGIGVGASTVRTLGRKPARLAALEASIQAVQALMAGESVEWEGTSIEMPWSARRVPVTVACSGPRSLRLAGRVADRVMFQVGSHPAFVAWALRNIQEGALAAGREPEDVEVLARLGCAVSEDGELARDELKGYAAAAAMTVAMSVPADTVPEEIRADLQTLEDNYDWYSHASSEAVHKDLVTDDLMDAIGIAGTPADVIPRLRELAELGLDGFVIPLTMSDPSQQMTVLADAVIPSLDDPGSR